MPLKWPIFWLDILFIYLLQLLLEGGNYQSFLLSPYSFYELFFFSSNLPSRYYFQSISTIISESVFFLFYWAIGSQSHYFSFSSGVTGAFTLMTWENDLANYFKQARHKSMRCRLSRNILTHLMVIDAFSQILYKY